MTKNKNKVVSITEAAKINKVTRQAIYVAIKLKKLRAVKETSRWTISLTDLEEYRRNKYSRTKSTFNGELIYDHNKGHYSVKEAATLMKVPAQKIYYALRIGLIKGTRRGAAWVIHMDEISQYRSSYLSKRDPKSKAS